MFIAIFLFLACTFQNQPNAISSSFFLHSNIISWVSFIPGNCSDEATSWLMLIPFDSFSNRFPFFANVFSVRCAMFRSIQMLTNLNSVATWSSSHYKTIKYANMSILKCHTFAIEFQITCTVACIRIFEHGKRFCLCILHIWTYTNKEKIIMKCLFAFSFNIYIWKYLYTQFHSHWILN